MSSTNKTHGKDKTSPQQKETKPAVKNLEAAAPEQLHPAVLVQRARLDPNSLTPRAVLQLQRTIGNRSVDTLLAGTSSRPVIQTKLSVGPAHDHYEREADRVAQQVMRAPVAAPIQRLGEEEEEIQAKPLANTITPLVQRAPTDEEELQTKPGSGGEAFDPGADFEQQLAAQKSSGQPLPGATRQFMESRFGADFSGVRVHADGAAAQLNRQVQAQAFTQGQDIFMGAGKYNPQSESGKQLLAHELTHTIQQGAAQKVQRKILIGPEKSEKEQDLTLIHSLNAEWKPEDYRILMSMHNAGEPFKFLDIGALETYVKNLTSSIDEQYKGVDEKLDKKIANASPEKKANAQANVEKERKYRDFFKKQTLARRKGSQGELSSLAMEFTSFRQNKELQELKENHLDKFVRKGGHTFISQFVFGNQIKPKDKDPWGWADPATHKNFVSTIPAADNVVKKAAGPKDPQDPNNIAMGHGLATVEKELGVGKGEWSVGGTLNHIYRFYIRPEKMAKMKADDKLDMARGTEGKAYQREWIGGMRTLSGVREAVIDGFKTNQDLRDAVAAGIVEIKKLTFMPSGEEPKQEDEKSLG